MKKTTTLATVAAVTLMGSALCHAQDASAKRQKQFNKLDADKNGSLILEEYTSIAGDSEDATRRAAFFKRLDADANGSLTFEEFTSNPNRRSKEQPAADAAE